MRKLFYNLQLFAAGDVVNGTASYVNANTPANSTTYTTTEGLSAEMKTFYDKALLTLASAKLVHEQLGQKRPIPKNGGKTIEWRRYKTLAKALTPITEGVTPSGNKLNVTPLTCTVDQFGDYIELTDMLELTAIDNNLVEATKKLADQAGRTRDTIVRNEIAGGTNVLFCPTKSGTTYTEVEYRESLNSTALLRVKDIFKAAATLEAANAPKIDGSYVAIIHPYIAYDLMQEAGDAWVDISKYTNPENIKKGEIGQLGNVRFLSSTEAKIFKSADLLENKPKLKVASYSNKVITLTTDADEQLSAAEATALAGKVIQIDGVPYEVASATAYATGTAATITVEDVTDSSNVPAANDYIYAGGAGKENCAVFATLVLGADAFGVVGIEGGGIEHIVKPRGYGNDPLNQRASAGWKTIMACKRLVDEYIVRIESGSSFSNTATAN